jgi:hypothetical protein
VVVLAQTIRELLELPLLAVEMVRIFTISPEATEL